MASDSSTGYTGRFTVRRVIYKSEGGTFGLPAGLCVLSVETWNAHLVPDGATIHDLKTWPEPFAALCDGIKRHEVRPDDRGFRVGDFLRLREWIPASRWEPLAETSSSGCSLFRCRSCGRVSKTPDKTCRTFGDPNESRGCSTWSDRDAG